MSVATIVVGIDSHDAWQDAVVWAADQAARARQEITLVHVADATEQLWHDTTGRDTRVGVVQAPTEGERLLKQAKARVSATAPGVPVHTVVLTGGVRENLHAVASGAAMLVVGAREHRTLWSRLFGTLGSALTNRPPCPAVVVHSAAPDEIRTRVLVGVDDTEHSQAALRFAFEQASARGLPVRVVHVAPEATYGEPVDEPEQRLEVSEAVAGFREEFPDVPVETTVARGVPSDVLLREESTARLVVLGAHHRRPISELLLGSVVAPVVEQAGCPVVVVPDPVS